MFAHIDSKACKRAVIQRLNLLRAVKIYCGGLELIPRSVNSKPNHITNKNQKEEEENHFAYDYEDLDTPWSCRLLRNTN
jgi:hypothetical protein